MHCTQRNYFLYRQLILFQVILFKCSDTPIVCIYIHTICCAPFSAAPFSLYFFCCWRIRRSFSDFSTGTILAFFISVEMLGGTYPFLKSFFKPFPITEWEIIDLILDDLGGLHNFITVSSIECVFISLKNFFLLFVSFTDSRIAELFLTMLSKSTFLQISLPFISSMILAPLAEWISTAEVPLSSYIFGSTSQTPQKSARVISACRCTDLNEQS